MCQDCLTATLPIVSLSLCLLSHFLANNGNVGLSLDGYFVHQQSVIQHLWRWRAPSVNLRTIRTLNSCPLCIAPAHSRVGEGALLLWRKPIDWLRNACGRNATERRKPLKSVLHSSRVIYMPFCARCSHQACATVAVSSLCNCTTCLRKVWTYISLYILIYIIHLAKSRIECDH